MPHNKPPVSAQHWFTGSRDCHIIGTRQTQPACFSVIKATPGQGTLGLSEGLVYPTASPHQGNNRLGNNTQIPPHRPMFEIV
jgi:hypothetical protein